MNIAGTDDWDNISLAVCEDFSIIKVVEVNDWIFAENKLVAMRTTNPFKPNERGVIYEAESITDNFATALSRLYSACPEITGCLTVFHEDTIIDKIKNYAGFAEVFGNHPPEKLIYRYRAVIENGIYRVIENTRG